MKTLNQRESIILFATLGLAAFFIVFQFVIKPVREGAMDINDQLRADQARLVKARQMVAQKDIVMARYQNLADMIGVADSEDTQMPAIVSKIEAAARESNIHIANIQPQKTVNQKEASFVAVELEIDGQWLDIVQFLYLLQQQPNFYFINELELAKYSDMRNFLSGRIVISRMCLVSP